MSSKFHNKWHRFNHHTNPKQDPRYPDSSHDPIASPESPFQGAFVINGPLSGNSSLSGFAASFASLSTALILDSDNYALSARGKLNIVGDTTQLGNYNITGNTTQIGNFDITGNTTQIGNTVQTGNVNIIGDLSATNGTITNNLVVYGNLSALGNISYLDTIVSITSALSVVNAGTGPAVTVNQTGTQPIANFEDDGTSVLFLGDGGLVGINTEVPTASLTVRGAISGFNIRTSFNAGSATGNFSFAEGSGKAFGSFSHAEGLSGRASGEFSHAEGRSTIASGNASHAEGLTTIASASASHAEGQSTTASGDRSHAEGQGTTASGNQSHAEGQNTIASGNQSHAEGTRSIASGDTSHAEGDSTQALAFTSHAEGRDTVASGVGSHAQNFFTVAIGAYSHAEGLSSVARGNTSHAGGYRAEAAQNYTYAWSDGLLGTATQNTATTRTGQYMVSASGGVFIPGNVGIGTDNNLNALTIRGTLSATTGIIDANTSTDALRITQTGSGNALVVEDSTNPDATPFVVTNVGNVGVGLTVPGEKLSVIGSISATGKITAVNGLSSEGDVNIFNNKRLVLGYSPAPAVNDGAELWMDYTNGNDAGELIISTRDNGNEPIIFRQRKDDAAPSWQREPLIIGSDSRIGVAAASGTRTFPAELTVYGNLSSARVAATSLSASTISLSAASTTLSMQLTTFANPVTATGEFILINVNGLNRAIQLWQY